MKKFTHLAVVSAFVVACSQPAQQSHTIEKMADNSRNALDWSGMYEGTLPCADCPGIKTKVQLNADESYTLSRLYLERSDSLFTDSGTFRWNDEGSVVTLYNAQGEVLIHFKVGENKLMALDMSGREIAEGWPGWLLLHKVDDNTHQ